MILKSLRILRVKDKVHKMKYVNYVCDKNNEPITNITLEEAIKQCKILGGRLPYMWEAYAFRSMETSNHKNINEWVIPNEGQTENMRGGCFYFNSWGLCAAFRLRFEPGGRDVLVGFRCVCEVNA